MRFSWLVVGTLVAASCVRSQTTECGHGVVCASGQVCVQATDDVIKCAAPEHTADCRDADRPDGELCEDSTGRCYDGFCLPIGCGDQLVDPTERCDDGNTLAEDGCSADCSSDEACGTGVVDPLIGEACDDGNLIAHDGCSPRCTIENPRWEMVVPEAARFGPHAASAFLPSRGRTLAFGGDDLTVGSEWTGTGWLKATTAFAPLERAATAMVYDPTRGVVVLHGGRVGLSQDRTDTWEWRRSGWSFVGDDGPKRAFHAMAYDPVRKKLVLFGGEEIGIGLIFHGDTWEWDGTSWTAIHGDAVPGDPAARRGHAMAYDARLGKVIMFGGRGVAGLFGDTWAWDGATWTRLATTGPSPREGMAVATDRMGIVLYGGESSGVEKDTWRWTGTWTKLESANLAATTSFTTATTDLARGVVVLTGGGDGVTWEWDGAKWTRVQPVAPTALTFAQSTTDTLRGDAIVVHDNQTSSVRGGCWSALTSAPGGARTTAGLVYDTLRDRVVLFGGETTTGPSADTWVMTRAAGLATWMQITGTGPVRRSEVAMAFDAARGTAVLFGGKGPAQITNNETWLFDTAWRQVTPATVPAARHGAAMGYDPVRERIVMFGGYTLSGTLDDVWEWDGTAWTEIEIQLRPPPRTGQLAMQTPEGIEMFGGGSKTGPVNETWLLSWIDTTATYDSCTGHLDLDGDGRVGCDDPECWHACSPLCGPGVSCQATAPTCGDGATAPQETCGTCAADLGACPLCGDLACEASETHATCPGDCP
jgi:cysteine-rich repeat protein